MGFSDIIQPCSSESSDIIKEEWFNIKPWPFNPNKSDVRTLQEISSVVDRAGITEVIVKMKTNEGHVGWGEAPRIASAEVIIKAIESMIPVLLNQDPWQNQLLESHIYKDANTVYSKYGFY